MRALQDNGAAVIVGTRTGGSAFKARLIEQHLPDAFARAASGSDVRR